MAFDCVSNGELHGSEGGERFERRECGCCELVEATPIR